jgi:hypothetical protein
MIALDDQTLGRNMPTNLTESPVTIGEVTSEWLTAVLSATYPGVEIVSSRVGPLFGNKPNKARIELKYNDAGRAAKLPPTMIVKASFPGLATTDERDFATTSEVVSYRDVVPYVGVNHPHCFHTALDWERGRATILMEDLALRGFRTRTALKSMTYREASVFVDAIARINGSTWNSLEFKPGGRWGPDSNVAGTTARLYEHWFPKIIQADWWDQFLDEPQATGLPRILNDRARVEKGWYRLMDVLSASATVIIHGDEHSGNLYFQQNGEPGFLDWLSRPERWPMHYAYFIMNNIDSLDRRAWERPLLERYLRGIAAHGVDAPCFEDAWYGYRCAILMPLIIWYTNPAKWQPAAVNAANASRAGLAMIDHDVFGLLGV